MVLQRNSSSKATKRVIKKPTTKPEPTGKNGLALHADDLRGMGEDVGELLAQLDPAKAKSLIYNWHFWARPTQIAPSGERTQALHHLLDIVPCLYLLLSICQSYTRSPGAKGPSLGRSGLQCVA